MAQARGSITDADQAFTETWENIVIHGNGVVRLDRRGDETVEMIQGRRRFFITTEERLLTEDRILEPKNNPFKNGDFRPIVVPEGIDTSTNPNALSDEEIAQIFKASELAWEEWLRSIDSPQTLRRMIDLAGESDISLKRYKGIGERLREVAPPTRIVQKDQEQYDKMAGATPPAQSSGRRSSAAVSPTSSGRQGGRSTDYS